MTFFQRIRLLIMAFFMMIGSLMMILDPEDGYYVILFVITLGLMLTGIRMLIYYFTMARFMVGGKLSLYRGLMLFDLGLFTGTLSNVPRIYVLLYLIVINGLDGVLKILSSLSSRKMGAKNWGLKLTHGMINILLVLVCIIFIRNHNTVSFVYATGLIISSIIRTVTAFRKTAMVYIQ